MTPNAPATPAQPIHTLIDARRKDLGLSQVELSELLGVTQAFLSHMLAGRRLLGQEKVPVLATALRWEPGTKGWRELMEADRRARVAKAVSGPVSGKGDRQRAPLVEEINRLRAEVAKLRKKLTDAGITP